MRALLFVALLLGSGGARAHDFWIEPDSFRVEPSQKLQARLRVGHGDDVRNVPRNPDRILRFEVIGPKGNTRKLSGKPQDEPAGRVKLEAPGTHVLVYRSNHAFIELAADKFDAYLKHEGLTDILERRKSSEGSGKESYARYCKSLVQVGDPSRGWDRDAGLPLELIPLSSPSSGEVAFRLEFRDAPLAGAQVELMRLDDLTQSTPGRTDAKGEVRFDEVPSGRFMVATTHMVEAKKPVKGDWESFWATLSFERRAPAADKAER